MASILIPTGILGAIGLLFGIVLTIADKFFAAEIDERVEAVRACVVGANCGACGFAGCDAFAEAVVAGKAKVEGCIPGGERCAAEIAEIMAVDAHAVERKLAQVMCQGTFGTANDRYTYDGYASCRVAASMAGGPKSCQYACVGLGDCLEHCAFGAISMRGGVAVINRALCRSCGMCVDSCPRQVIRMVPESQAETVRCANHDEAKHAREACLRACIACSRCVKACKDDAIEIIDHLAVINPEKCTRCGDCVKVCPMKCITVSV